MIKFHDPSGTPHLGQATITRTTSVNGGLSLTGEVFAGGDVLNGLDYGWWLNFDNEKYVITYKKLSDDTNTVVFDAIQQFFWDFAKVALHAQYTGSHEYTFYLGQLFDKSGYTYKNDVTVPAFEKENWGYKNKLDLFNDIIDQVGVEFEVHNETVHIAKQIGSDLTSFARKGINLSDLTEEMKISDFATYAKGYGAFKDAEDQSKGRLEVEYRSELAKQFGDLEMDPIVDERYTIADNLIAALKKQVDATYTVSMTMNIYDLENAGYPNYEAPKVGDWILAIDEALNFKRKIRIIQLEEQFDVTGKRIGYTATCGDLSIVDQYTHLQSSLDSKVQRIQESVDNALSSANGKSTNYYGEKEPTSANEGDLWFDQSDSDPDKWSIKQWVNGRWEQITLNPGEVDAKVDVAKKEAETAVENAKSASDKADQLAAKYDDTNALANQALDRAIDAQNSAAGLIDDVNKASQNADDAKSIANSVNSKYTTLTDGSTMTLAELENGLAAKLTKTDLDGYATQTWTQNQIKVTTDGINTQLSSVKTTVDGHTTLINNLQADSSGFKAQFITVNNTLGKQGNDIGTLQATSKSLTSSFDSLSSKNDTNEHNISQLQQTATSLNSTLMTVQQRVVDSAVGTNLLLKTGTPYTMTANGISNQWELMYRLSRRVESGTKLTLSFDVAATADCNITVQNNGNLDGGTWDGFLDKVPVGLKTKHYVSTIQLTGFSQQGINLRLDEVTSGTKITVSNMKLEIGDFATDFSVNPADNATIDSVSSISQTVDAIQTTVRGKVDNDVYQSKMTQLDSQITSVVGQVNSLGQKNLIANSQFQYDWQNSWSISSHDWANWYTSNFTWAWLDGYQGVCANIPQDQSESWPHVQSSDVAIPDPGVTAYSASVYVNIDWVETYCVLDMSFYDATGTRTFHDTTAANKGMNFLKLENIVSPKNAVRVHIELHVHDHGHVAFIEPMFVQDSTVGKYIPDNASWTEVQQTYDSINLKVSKDGVVNAVNISPEGIQIYGNKLHITAATYIDNAVIKDAMIANLNANKLTAGSINAANINVYNINGANIVANSITANQLQAGSLLIALNSTMQTMRIGTDGLYTTDNKGDGVGHIHTNSVVGHPDVYGLNFDLDATGDYMGWGAKNRGDPNGTYAIKLGWYRSDTANTIGNIKGFVFSDQVTLNGGIQVSGAYQNLGFGTSTFNNNTHYPYFGSTGMRAGLAYGSTDTYLISDGKYADMTKVIFALQGIGDAYIPVKLSDGKITSYVKVNFQH
ncbi:phage tail protein [Lactiplantibacillus plantarum]|uniref:phage tail protein n=1 Tax=Lactiplantibacillus plantarum TaxID=1590 RepID=UPI000977981C|nr:phage tail protein [Lactiplantibacillus plantarum]